MASQKPVVVYVLCSLYALGALAGLIQLATRGIDGVRCLDLLISIGLGIGLWRLQDWARRAAILLLALGLIVGVIIVVAILIPQIAQGHPVSIIGLMILAGIFMAMGFLLKQLMSAPVRTFFLQDKS